MKDRFALVDADLLQRRTRFPNLALMKISAHLRKQGGITHLITDFNEDLSEYEEIYLSKIFSDPPLEWNPGRHVIMGGTGLSQAANLPQEVEHIKPHYGLYWDHVMGSIAAGYNPSNFKAYEASIGFMSRGCPRRCPFCINRESSGSVRHSSVYEFLDKDRPVIICLDDNVFACPEWREIFFELQGTGKPFTFKQGLDVRLLDKEKAEILSKSHYHGEVIFAFDNVRDAPLIDRKLALWRKNSQSRTKVYVLCSYFEHGKQDLISIFERVKILFSHGCVPYLMRYGTYEQSPLRNIYIHLARWLNQPRFSRYLSFREFAAAPSQSQGAREALRQLEAIFTCEERSLLDLKYKKP